MPFQRRISVLVLPLVLSNSPTAQASVGERAVTALSSLSPALGLGLLTRDQVVPLQCRVSVGLGVKSMGWPKFPTAQASVGESALTPRSWLNLRPGCGLLTRDQVVPFQSRVTPMFPAPEGVL